MFTFKVTDDLKFSLWPRDTNVTDEQTDKRTDRQLNYRFAR